MKLDNFLGLIRDIPKIKKLEKDVHQRCYWYGSPKMLKEYLYTNPPTIDHHTESLAVLTKILSISNTLKLLFKKLPLKLQKIHIFNISSYMEEGSYFETYMLDAIASTNVITNYLILSYAEIILPQIDKSEREEFLNKIKTHIKISKGVGPGYDNFEKIEFSLIATWTLENELNKQCNPKKTIKI